MGIHSQSKGSPTLSQHHPMAMSYSFSAVWGSSSLASKALLLAAGRARLPPPCFRPLDYMPLAPSLGHLPPTSTQGLSITGPTILVIPGAGVKGLLLLSVPPGAWIQPAASWVPLFFSDGLGAPLQKTPAQRAVVVEKSKQHVSRCEEVDGK